jgi:hypothetical protein
MNYFVILAIAAVIILVYIVVIFVQLDANLRMFTWPWDNE